MFDLRTLVYTRTLNVAAIVHVEWQNPTKRKFQ